MSNAVQALVWALDIKMEHKIVLLKMADCANDDGEGVWLSVERIMAQCGCSERHVQNVRKYYIDAGVIAVEARPYHWIYKGKSMPVPLYKFDLEALAEFADPARGDDAETAETVDTETREGAPGAPSTLGEGAPGAGVQVTTREGAPGAPKPSENPHERKKKTKAKKERKPADGIEPGEIEAFLAVMPRVDLPDDARSAYIQARLAGATRDEIMAAGRAHAAEVADRPPKFVKDAANWLAGGGHKAKRPNGAANGEPPPPRPLAEDGVDPDLVAAWKSVLGRMRAQIGEAAYRSWFRGCLTLSGAEDGRAVIEARRQFHADWVEAQYGPMLAEAWREKAGLGVRIKAPAEAALARAGT